MSEKLVQLNVRVPREVAQVMKTASAMLGVTVQQLGADAIACYYHVEDDEVRARQQKAIEAIKRAFPGGSGWCALKGSNLGPLPCEGSELRDSDAATVPNVLDHFVLFASNCSPAPAPHVLPELPVVHALRSNGGPTHPLDLCLAIA